MLYADCLRVFLTKKEDAFWTTSSNYNLQNAIQHLFQILYSVFCIQNVFIFEDHS
jgi:hypothetical protein